MCFCVFTGVECGVGPLFFIISVNHLHAYEQGALCEILPGWFINAVSTGKWNILKTLLGIHVKSFPMQLSCCCQHVPVHI